MILITSYLDPDIDGTASAMAYAELLRAQGKVAEAALYGTPSVETLWVADRFKIPLPSSPDLSGREVVVVDASDKNLLDLAGLKPEQVVEIIDHRAANDASYFSNAKVQIEKVGSCATLIAERFISAGREPSSASAILMASALISNTLNFNSGNTTDRDRKAYAWLGSFAALPADHARNMFIAKSDLSGNKLEARMENEYALMEFSGKKVMICQIEMVGTQELMREREAEMIATLNKLAVRLSADYYFLSLVELDPENSLNIFISEHPESRKILESILGLHFDGLYAVRPGLIMRKEIFPLVQKYLGN